METVAIVLSVGNDKVEDFEAGFRAQELPIWEDFRQRGVLVRASLNRLDITSHEVAAATQYLVVVTFAGSEGHHLHDADPRFNEWNQIADAFQVGDGMAFGGEMILQVGGAAGTEAAG